MKIIVIGSKGFIGSHVFRYYRKTEGPNTWGCDIVADYNTSNYFLIDATNSDFDKAFEGQSFEVCINCSGASSVFDSFVHPSRDFSLNVHNVQRILDAIRKHSPRCKFLNLSSAAVYGNPTSLPIIETDTIQPVSPYGWNKFFSEQICNEYFRLFGIPTCSARIFSAYGPGLMKQLFWDWHQKIRNGKHLTIIGTGKESRDFIYIEDIVRAIILIVEKGDFAGEAINIGNGEEVFISQAIEIFKDTSSKEFTCSFEGSTRKGDPINWRADISKLESLGYRQNYSLSQGLKMYHEWINTL